MTNRSVINRTVAVILIAFCTAMPSAAAFEIVMAAENLVQFTEQSFIQNVFGNQRSYAAARKYAEQALLVQIEFVENAVVLTEAQRSKLELAGHGDIHRFFNDYERVKRGMTFGGIPRDEWQAVWQRTQPLATRYKAGLHGSKSLFAKTVASTLESDQRNSFQEMKKDRDVAIYIDNIRMTLSMVDRKVPLTRRQRETITELLVNETTPPDFYGQANMHFYVVLFQMAKLPEEDLKSNFSVAEWRVLKAMLQQAKAMEHTLNLQRKALEE